MPKTVDNLMKMFTSGSESSIRYRVFAEAADKEGHSNAAKIFRAIATAKMFHALSHFRAANFVDSTTENLKQALEEETYDCKNGYPSMIQDAVADAALEARHSLEYGMSIGPVITRFISSAIGNPDADEGGCYYVCPVCGNIEFGQPPAKCPFCGVDATDFVEVA
ncbi:MAG: rubrerythrin family protein [Desulfobacterales bacterium]|nr:MAG: rubrerythrin family protein [Desulfobacterales bacterium]